MAVRLEIETTKHWMIRPEFVHAMRRRIRQGETAFLDVEVKDKVAGEHVPVSANAEYIREAHISTRTGRRISSWDDDNTDLYINLLYVCGPITRGGDACSYGSADHRDMVMSAADDDRCVAHVFFIDTPGGSAWAKNDYQQAIAYARSKNQPVLAFIDGMCASAGMYLASMCDERYYMHPNDEVGCVGAMAAFYTVADGSKNQFTDETYHEIYADGSTWKNKEFRDIANEGNDELFKQELNELNEEFVSDMHKAFPKATDDMLTGKMYKASKVQGIFLDGQATLAEVLGIAIERSATNGVEAGVKARNIINNQHKTTTNMNTKYQTVAQACGVDELVVSNEGTHLDVSLVDNLQNSLAALNATIAERDKSVASLNEQISVLKNGASNAEQLNATIAERDKSIAELNGQIANLNTQLTDIKAQLATAQQTIADRDATISELITKPGEAPDAGEGPKNNGTGAAVPHMAVIMPKYDATKSPLENKRIREEYEKNRAERIHR